MLRTTGRKTKQKQGRVKYVGIVADAKKLGVNRVTLWRVLAGEWQSRSLTKRYQELKKEQEDGR
jgi:hypothetical protein